MKAIKVNKFGSSEVLIYSDESRPTVADNEVLIKIEAAGIGRVDISARQGHYAPLSTPGFIPGIEVAGEVVLLGKDVDKKWLGKKVFARVFSGGYAEEISLSVASLVEIPKNLTTIEAIAFGVNALVASFSLDLSGLGNGDRLLIRGASGGIGSVATLIAKAMGIHVTAAIRSESKKEYLKQLGIKDFLLAQDIADSTLKYHAILDLVLGGGIDACVNLLEKNGNYIIAGGSGGSFEIDFGMSFLKRVHLSLSLHIFSLNAFSDTKIGERMTHIFKLITDHQLRAPIHKIFSLKEAIKAHDFMESGDVFGKIILTT